MGREWYPSDEGTWHCQVGVDWQYSSDANNVYIAPIIYRWDANNTNNSGSRFWETLSPDTNGSGSWSGYGWGSGFGTRQVDSFNQRTYSRGHSAYNVTLTIGWDSSFGTWYGGSFRTIGSGQHSWVISVPAKSSYTVSYNANGGSGAPSNQTKWYGENLTLSSTKPTKSGYEFVGWATLSSATSVNYASGSTYTGNAALTLYAVWVQNIFTCTIHYDANGGTGAPVNQTHVQKSTSTISSTKPTRHGYTFLGWSTSKSATKATYISNGRYTNDSFSDGATITLYAVWAVAYPNTYVKIPDEIERKVVDTIIDDVLKMGNIKYKTIITVPESGGVLSVYGEDIFDYSDTVTITNDAGEQIANWSFEGGVAKTFSLNLSQGDYGVSVMAVGKTDGFTVKVTLTYNETVTPSINAIYVRLPDEFEREVVRTVIKDVTIETTDSPKDITTITVPSIGGVLTTYRANYSQDLDAGTVTILNENGEVIYEGEFGDMVTTIPPVNLSGGKYTIRLTVMRKIAQFTVDKMTLTTVETSAPSLKAVYYNVEDLNLTTSDNLSLVDSGGNYLMAK